MPWTGIKTSQGERLAFKQDATMGCAIACVATIKNWYKGWHRPSEDVESEISGQLEKGNMTVKQDNASTNGVGSLTTARLLLSSTALDTEPLEDLKEDGLAKAMKNASPESVLFLGVAWKTGGKHVVMCLGPDANNPDKVSIYDPGDGLVHSHKVGEPYQNSGGVPGTIEANAFVVHNSTF